jgi:phage-related protein
MPSINGCDFTYAGEHSQQHGVIKCYINSVDASSNDEETNLITSTTSGKRTWDLHGIQKSAPLRFPFTIAQPNGDFIDIFKERELKKWLLKTSYNWLNVEQDDFANMNFYCIFTNPRKVDAGGTSIGLCFDVICDSSNAWSDLKTILYTNTTTGTINLNIDMDYEDEEVYPLVTITSLASGDISISNTNTSQSVTLTDCETNEVIILDGVNGKIKTSVGNKVLLDSWNKTFLNLKSGFNTISLTGNFTIKIEYRLPIRIGG